MDMIAGPHKAINNNFLTIFGDDFPTILGGNFENVYYIHTN